MKKASAPLLWAVLCLAAFALLGRLSSSGDWRQQPPIAPHRRAAADAVPLGASAFSIRVLDDDQTIAVVHDSSTIILEIQNIQAAKGWAYIEENRGLFQVRDFLWSRTDEYSVDEVDTTAASGASVTIRGDLIQATSLFFWTLFRKPVLKYSLVFSIVPESTTQQIAFTIRVTTLDGSEQDKYNRVFLTHDSTPDEMFLGFGEQFTYLDMKGKDPTIVTSENGVGRGASLGLFFNLIFGLFLNVEGSYDSTYAPMPYYMTNAGRALVLENYEISQFDLKEHDSATIKVLGTELRGRLMQGDTPLDLIESFTEYSGRMEPLPEWMNRGAVVGMQGGTDKVLSAFAKLQDLEAPIGAFWLQDWVGKRTTALGSQLWWNWVLDQNTYPGWSDMVAQLEADGVRVMTYISPFLANVDESEEYEGGENLYETAQSGDYLVKDWKGNPYLIPNSDFSAGLVDLTNPEAREWYKGIIKSNVIGMGASGYMADFGEALPFDAVLFSGESSETYHNKYPEDWQMLNKEAIAELGRTGEIVYFTRSGYTKTPGLAALMWAGDQMTTWDEYDGLKSAITALLSGGFSGLSLNHSDIGGWFAFVNNLLSIEIVRTRELFLRWSEMNAFTAVYRTHDGVAPDANVQFYTDDETYEHFATFAKVYSALAFYRSTLMQEAAEKGYPVVRHPLLHYPDDPRAYELKYQWMLGTEFMVAPVVEEDQSSVSVYLPTGSWIHVWSQETFEGGTDYNIDAPIGQPPVFYRTGSAVGLQFISNLQASGVL